MRRKRHGLQDDAVCVLCSQEEESISHLLLSCVLAREVWHCILSRLGWQWQALMPGRRYLDLASWWSSACRELPKTDRKCFGSLVILTSWSIWLERNRTTLNHLAKVMSEIISELEDHAVLWDMAGFSLIIPSITALGRLLGRQLFIM